MEELKMINWESIQYDVNTAAQDFIRLKITACSVKPIDPREDLVEIRKILIEKRDLIFEENDFDFADKLDYQFDLLFALELYQLLSERNGFTNRMATNDDIWRYLSVCVIPDIVHSRWGLNEDHFYRMSRRIWLKSIWWYIHLSWMENKENTYNILKGNTTDTILQLVERPGVGYYISVFREIMSQYSNYQDNSRIIFRRVLKLNTARLLTTSPELVEGGVKEYVSTLFDLAMEE